MDIIYNGAYGSHLYGLQTKDSDHDYKGVYAPAVKDLVFHTYKDSIEKQTPEVDETYYAITKFLKILGKCDMVSTDMLYSNKEAAIEASPLWWKLREYRQDVLCKNSRGLLGYIRTQSSKYGHKVQRYEEMCDFLSVIKESLYCNQIIKDTIIPEMIQRLGYKYITLSINNKRGVEDHIDICGSKYQLNAQVHYMEKGLEQKIARYGERTKKGSLSNGDWKSLSHAYRVLVQMEEMIETRDLIFPLINAEEILMIKTGQVSQDRVMSMIDEKYDTVVNKLDKSDLPEHNDLSRMEAAVMDYYGL